VTYDSYRLYWVGLAGLLLLAELLLAIARPRAP
jgi:hypothetical protein